MFAPRSSRARAAVVAVALLTGLGLTACGSSDSPSSAPAAPSAPSNALPLPERVVSDDLGGLARSSEVQEVKTAQEYAALVNADDAEDPDLAEKRRLDAELATQHGFVRAAVKNFGTNASGSGTSIAIQLGSTEQAKEYEQTLFDEEFSDLPGAEKGTIPGAAQSHTMIVSAEDEGLTNTLVLAAFVDGPFVYVLNAGGTDPTFNRESAGKAIDQAKQLHAKVKDRPAP